METPTRDPPAVEVDAAPANFEAAGADPSQPIVKESMNQDVTGPAGQLPEEQDPTQQHLTVSAYPSSEQTHGQDQVSAATGKEQASALGAADSMSEQVPVEALHAHADFVVHQGVPSAQTLSHLGPHMTSAMAVSSADTDTDASVPSPSVPTAYAVPKDTMAELHLAAHLAPGLADPGLRSILPQTEAGLYIPAPHLSGLAAGSLHYAAQQQHQQDAGRKRSKTSRACDECRRRKSKCDAAPETGDAPCTNCRRVKAVCLFTRIPQKRGPSKGYIRELANRISGIESKLDTERGLKRSFTTLATADDVTVESGRGNAWPETRPLLLSAPTEKLHPLFTSDRSSIGNSSTGPTPSLSLSGIPPSIKDSLSGVPPSIKNSLSGLPPATKDSLPLHPIVPDGSAGFEIDHRVIDGYFSAIHPLLPLLPDAPDALYGDLLRCPAALRDAFIDVFFAAVHSLPGHESVPPGDLIRANLKLVSWQFSQHQQQQHQSDKTAGLVYMQILLLQAIQADNRAAGEAGLDKTELLGRAAAQGVRMKLYAGQALEDQESVLRTRVWRCLVVMDHWHSVGMGQQPLVREEYSVATHALRRVLPTQLFYMTRLNALLTLASTIITCMVHAPSSAAKPSVADIALGGTLGPWADRFREDLPDDITPATHPVLHMSYWHARLLAQMVATETSLGALLWPCRELVGLMTGDGGSSSMALFGHHFLVLVARVLHGISQSAHSHEASANDAELRQEAARLLAKVLGQPDLTSHWLARVRSIVAGDKDGVGGEEGGEMTEGGEDGTQPVIASSEMHATAALTLRKLAALMATDADADADADETPYNTLGFDPRVILRSGYLRGLP